MPDCHPLKLIISSCGKSRISILSLLRVIKPSFLNLVRLRATLSMVIPVSSANSFLDNCKVKRFDL